MLRQGNIQDVGKLRGFIGVLREETDNEDVECLHLLEHVPKDVGAAPVGMTTARSRSALTEKSQPKLAAQDQYMGAGAPCEGECKVTLYMW